MSWADDALDTIVVTASPIDKSIDDLAAPVTVLDRNEILRHGSSSLGDLLGQKPGIAQSSFARGASRPIIRGLDNFRVRLQENGVGSHDVSDLSEDHGAPIDPLAAQKVEVIRGPATLRYGSQSIGGVVSILNNRIPTTDLEQGFNGETYGTYSTVDKGHELAGLFDFGAERFAVHVDAIYRSADDYNIPVNSGKQANSGNEALGMAGGGSFLFPNGFIGASVSHFESQYGIPGDEPAQERVFIDLEQIKATLKGEIKNLGSFLESVRFGGGYSDYTHDEVIGADDNTASSFNNKEGEARIEFLQEKIGPIEGALGFHYAYRDLEGLGEARELIAPARRQSFAAFVFEDMEATDMLTIQFGARIEHVKADGFGVTPPILDGSLLATEIDDFGNDLQPDFTPINGSVGILYKIPYNMIVSGTVQYVERAPALLELFAKGPHEATRTFEIGNPNLNKEKAISFEAGLRKVEGDITFSLTTFYNKYDGFIFKALTGRECGEEFDTCGVEDEFVQIAYTQEDARFAGIEAEAAWEAFDLGNGVVSFDARFDFMDAELETSGNLPRIPPMRYGTGVTFENERLFSRVSILRVGKQDRVAANERPTRGHTDLRAEFIYSVPLGDEKSRTLSFGLVGTNLLDQDQRNHIAFNKDDVSLPGANVRLFVRATF